MSYEAVEARQARELDHLHIITNLLPTLKEPPVADKEIVSVTDVCTCVFVCLCELC